MNVTPTEKLVEAYRYLKANNPAAARIIIKDVIRQFPGSERAWLMMSLAVNAPAHQADCLRRVLSINPNNQEARRRLDQLLAVPTPVAEAPAPVVEAAPAPEPKPEPEPNWLYQPTAPGKPMTRPLNGHHLSAPRPGTQPYRQPSAASNGAAAVPAEPPAPVNVAPPAPPVEAAPASAAPVVALLESASAAAPAPVSEAPAAPELDRPLNGAAPAGGRMAARVEADLAREARAFGAVADPCPAPPPLNRARRKLSRARLLRTQAEAASLSEAAPAAVAAPELDLAPAPSAPTSKAVTAYAAPAPAIPAPEAAVAYAAPALAIPAPEAAVAYAAPALAIPAPEAAVAYTAPAPAIPASEVMTAYTAPAPSGVEDLPELPATGELPEAVSDPAPVEVPSWLLTPTQASMPVITPLPAIEEAPRKAAPPRDPDAMLRWLVPALIGTWVAFIVIFVVGFIFFAPR